jgi:hypothetical protein
MAIPILLDSGIPPEQQVWALTKCAKGNNRSDKNIFRFINWIFIIEEVAQNSQYLHVIKKEILFYMPIQFYHLSILSGFGKKSVY